MTLFYLLTGIVTLAFAGLTFYRYVYLEVSAPEFIFAWVCFFYAAYALTVGVF